MAKPLGERSARIRDYLAKHPESKPGEVAEALHTLYPTLGITALHVTQNKTALAKGGKDDNDTDDSQPVAVGSLFQPSSQPANGFHGSQPVAVPTMARPMPAEAAPVVRNSLVDVSTTDALARLLLAADFARKCGGIDAAMMALDALRKAQV